MEGALKSDAQLHSMLPYIVNRLGQSKVSGQLADVAGEIPLGQGALRSVTQPERPSPGSDLARVL